MKNALALVCCLMGTVSVADTHKATFGGGCFWCLEPPFESIHGVSAVVSGYAGGSTSHPTYAEVTAGWTGSRARIPGSGEISLGGLDWRRAQERSR